MAINIKDPETDRLLREVAQKTGESLTETVRTALRERLQRVSGRQRTNSVKANLEAVLIRVDALPHLDIRSEDEILGYDEQGIPRGW